MKDIMVSIICLTYNQKKYIKDAIEGFLIQKVNFNYEIVIHDDASTDGTASVIREYEEKYPQKIKGIYEKENQYQKRNLKKENYGIITRKTEKYVKGKYVAVCEGDDYWLDENKLQLQVEYLEDHPECIMVLHDAVRLNCNTGKIDVVRAFHDGNRNLSVEELIMQYNGHPPTASTVCRAEAYRLGGFFTTAPAGDYPWQLYAYTLGDVYYSNRIMSVYRSFAQGSISSSISRSKSEGFLFNIGMLDFLLKYDEYTNKEYHNWIWTKIYQYIYDIINLVQDKQTIYRLVDDCKGCGKAVVEEYKEYYQQIEKLCKEVFDEYYCSSDILTFVHKYKYTVIWGAGKFGQIVARQLDNNAVNFQGFVVSKLEDDMATYLGKSVWEINNIPFDRKEVGIIIAIGPVAKIELIEILDNEKNLNYIWPFLVNNDEYYSAG